MKIIGNNWLLNVAADLSTMFFFEYLRAVLLYLPRNILILSYDMHATCTNTVSIVYREEECGQNFGKAAASRVLLLQER